MIVIGILLMAGEFRFNTITTTFLITPEPQAGAESQARRLGIVGAQPRTSSLRYLRSPSHCPGSPRETSTCSSHSADIAVVLLEESAPP